MSPPGDGSQTSELTFLALGGAGEIGMNLNLYGYAGKWLIVDCGVTFGDDTTPGIEVIMPDPAWIAERRRDLVGIVATHAHEDHIGAIPYLWPRLGCPIYATAFTTALLKRKLTDVDLLRRVSIVEVPTEGRFTVGPFDVELIRLTHSIPEPMALAIRTPMGAVLHTGDWKLDPEPLIGEIADEAGLRSLGEAGVLALVGDSTNVFRPGESGSEAEVRANLMRLVGRYKARVAVACFASNVARLESLARVAEAHGRHAALIGRSLWRIYDAARETGYLRDIPEFVTEHDAGFLPKDKVLLICTGSQGEPRSALARIAGGNHPHVVLEPDDVAIFSSRIIPGNERAIGRLHNQLSRLGVEVVSELDDEGVHVSGHPSRDELVRMYQWVRPAIAIPVHGEMRHLVEHAKLARECQVPQAIVVENGSLVRLAPAPAGIIDHVTAGRLALDGTSLSPLDSGPVQARRRLMRNGAAVVSLVVSRDGKLKADPAITFQGVVDDEKQEEMRAAAIAVARQALDKLSPAERRDDALMREVVRLAVRRLLHDRLGKRPQTDVQLIRV